MLLIPMIAAALAFGGPSEGEGVPAKRPVAPRTERGEAKKADPLAEAAKLRRAASGKEGAEKLAALTAAAKEYERVSCDASAGLPAIQQKMLDGKMTKPKGVALVQSGRAGERIADSEAAYLITDDLMGQRYAEAIEEAAGVRTVVCLGDQPSDGARRWAHKGCRQTWCAHWNCRWCWWSACAWVASITPCSAFVPSRPMAARWPAGSATVSMPTCCAPKTTSIP